MANKAPPGQLVMNLSDEVDDEDGGEREVW